MRLRTGLVILALGVSLPVSLAQTPENQLSASCATMLRVRGRFPNGPFKFLPNEKYRGGPLVRFDVGEDGLVANVRIARSSGIADIDKKTVNAVAAWRYKPRPGCPVIEIEMGVTIDWQ